MYFFSHYGWVIVFPNKCKKINTIVSNGKHTFFLFISERKYFLLFLLHLLLEITSQIFDLFVTERNSTSRILSVHWPHEKCCSFLFRVEISPLPLQLLVKNLQFEDGKMIAASQYFSAGASAAVVLTEEEKTFAEQMRVGSALRMKRNCSNESSGLIGLF